MENMLSNHGHPEYAPRRPYKPSSVTTGEFMTALNQIEVEHQKNADFLKNPYPAIEFNEFHKQAGTAQMLAEDLSLGESRGLPSARKNLAHGQEVILYGTSRLRTAVNAWIQAVQEDETYDQSRTWWMSSLSSEVWGLFTAIGVYASTGAGGPYTHPLILETSNMLQQRMIWCTTNNDPEGIHFSEKDYIAGIQRYLDVDTDDPTRIVDGYLNAWWWGDCNAPAFPSYAFDPYDYLEIHRPQIQFTWKDVRPVPYAAGDMAEIRLIMKTFDDLHSTWKRVAETVREHDAQLEKDRKLLAYWEDMRTQIQEQESE